VVKAARLLESHRVKRAPVVDTIAPEAGFYRPLV
jgi:hypothetical protein